MGAKDLGYGYDVVPPGKRSCPFHSHRGEEEMFFILEGQGELRFGDQRYPLRPHDVVACPAGGPEVEAVRLPCPADRLPTPGGVPDGLGEGGLKIDDNALTSGWHNAKDPTQAVAGVKPLAPLQLAGRDIYVREGCYNCHSQMIRPFRAETLRYGHYSVAGEFVYDHPFQWGSKRTGPDLHRVGGKYSDEWHRIHLVNPRDVVPESNMPGFPWLETAAVDVALVYSVPPHPAAVHVADIFRDEIVAIVSWAAGNGDRAVRSRAAPEPVPGGAGGPGGRGGAPGRPGGGARPARAGGRHRGRPLSMQRLV